MLILILTLKLIVMLILMKRISCRTLNHFCFVFHAKLCSFHIPTLHFIEFWPPGLKTTDIIQNVIKNNLG